MNSREMVSAEYTREYKKGIVSVLDDKLLPIRRKNPKIGRNDPCPCGSGKKYKNCCLKDKYK